jgi:integrase
MSFLVDVQELKTGLIIFRRSDVQHRNWYCRVRVPKEDRYKTFSLKTADINEAKDKAFDHDADIRFRIKHEVPVFEKSFAQVAAEYSAYLKSVAESGQITMRRWLTVDGHIRLHLTPYMGGLQIAHVNEDKWKAYPLWRKKNGQSKTLVASADKENKTYEPVKDGTIRQEMNTYRAVMNFAADKQYIRERQVPRGKLPSDEARREAFTPQEYRKLHTFARSWIKETPNTQAVWYRTMTYNFVLVMANTGMRTMEARNLLWRDIDLRSDRQGRKFVAVNVRGKGKFRELVAASNVAEYFERIRAVSKAVKPEDPVFSTIKGEAAETLYKSLIDDLLEKSGLLMSSSGSRRSTYCFRHTYATFRLMEGIDVYFLAKQMGTSVKMIEKHYGHITPIKNAERILQGLPGWEPVLSGPRDEAGSVHAAAPRTSPKKPRTKK